MVLALSVTTFVAFGLMPLGAVLMRGLEAPRAGDHTARTPPSHILVLAGGEALHASKRRGMLEVNGHGDRILAGLTLSRAHPDARLWIVGAGRETSLSANDVESVAEFWRRAGVASRRISTIGGSDDTCANLADFAEADRLQGRTVLVTSAFHMPRALACAEAAGFRPIPYPVDYKTGTGGWSFNVLANLNTLDLAAHELIGLIFYKLEGRT